MSEISLDIQDIVLPKFREPYLLVHPTIPKPLHGVNPRSILGRSWWDETRKKVYGENNFCCMACGIYRGNVTPRAVLHAHEVYDIDYEHYKVALKRIVALCPNCHDYIHIQRIGALYDQGVIDEEDCWIIHKHGLSVVGRNKDTYKQYLTMLESKRKYGKSWKKWHLEIDGKKYYSKFKNQKEWEEHYAATKN